MAIEVVEQPVSRSGKASIDQATEIVYEYRVTGSDEILDLVAAVDSVAPLSGLDPVKSEPIYRTDLSWRRIGWQTYEFLLTYSDRKRYDERKQLETGEYQISFSTVGGTSRLLVSKETIAAFTETAEAVPPENFAANGIPDFQQAIGVTADRDVEGVDVVTPALKFTIHYRQPNATITEAYAKKLEELTGTVNDDVFFGRPAGEVLFLGAEGSQGNKDDPVVDYQFLRLPNVSGETIGQIKNVSKKGHEYLWVLFRTSEDEDAKKNVKRPLVAYVERVYDLADFSELGIGTG